MSFEVCYVINAVVHLQVLWLTNEVGLSLSSAGLYSSLTFALSLAGKVGFGYGLDSARRRAHGLAACVLLTVGGALMLRPVRTSTGAWGLASASAHVRSFSASAFCAAALRA